MIIVKLSGGLGNQLFQYSFGRYLSLKYNTEVKFDLQLNVDHSTFTMRLLGLSKYKINLKIATKKEINNYKLFTSGIFSRIERKIVQRLPFINKKIVVEDTFKIIDDTLLNNDCYYDGYWQSDYYFRSISDTIRQDFQIDFELNEESKVLEKKIKDHLSVSIHVRRGDYISVNSNAKIYSICSLDYYKEGIEFFRSKFEEPFFYIFSDDVKWIKENLQGVNCEIVDVNKDNPHADLYLMSLCKHNIIANSSFSWWGAWLNSNKKKIVISPQKWYNNEKTNDKAVKSLIPEDWIII